MGLYTAKQLQLEEVLIKAICAPVAGAHAAKTDMAAKRHRNVGIHHQPKTTGSKQHIQIRKRIQSKDKNLNSVKAIRDINGPVQEEFILF